MIKGLEIETARPLAVQEGNFLVTTPGKTKTYRATYVSSSGLVSAESYRADFAVRDLTYKLVSEAQKNAWKAKTPIQRWLVLGGIAVMYVAAGALLWWFFTWASSHLR